MFFPFLNLPPPTTMATMADWILQKFSSHDALAREAAKQWLDLIDAAGKRRQPLCVGLAGGRIADLMMHEIAVQSGERKMAWHGVHFFWGDERCVPADDPESNFRLAAEAFLTPCAIPNDQIHRIPGEMPPDDAARLAKDELAGIVLGRHGDMPVLDHVLLGMGEDGHIASLFPGAAESLVQSREVFIPVIGPKPPPERISLTYAMLAAAREVWVIAAGDGKSEALAAALTGPVNPLGRLLTLRATTQIFTDVMG
jgi:6-phosphogluconolactonase